MNQTATTATVGSVSTLDPITANSATQPTYTALILDGWAPTLSTGAAARRRIILRKCITASKLAVGYEKAKPVVYNCTWSAYYISASIGLFHIVDQIS
jgi:hypothetical protein